MLKIKPEKMNLSKNNNNFSIICIVVVTRCTLIANKHCCKFKNKNIKMKVIQFSKTKRLFVNGVKDCPIL